MSMMMQHDAVPDEDVLAEEEVVEDYTVCTSINLCNHLKLTSAITCSKTARGKHAIASQTKMNN
jgi:hypothetical protein